jgi:hypothetical protein
MRSRGGFAEARIGVGHDGAPTWVRLPPHDVALIFEMIGMGLNPDVIGVCRAGPYGRNLDVEPPGYLPRRRYLTRNRVGLLCFAHGIRKRLAAFLRR